MWPPIAAKANKYFLDKNDVIDRVDAIHLIINIKKYLLWNMSK